jgi:hypothetical protein
VSVLGKARDRRFPIPKGSGTRECLHPAGGHHDCSIGGKKAASILLLLQDQMRTSRDGSPGMAIFRASVRRNQNPDRFPESRLEKEEQVLTIEATGC